MKKLLAVIALLVILAGCTQQTNQASSGTGSETGSNTGTRTLESIGDVSTGSLNNLTSELQGMSFDEFGGITQ
jgi:hypothetical protein